jgi:hypothetical protein
VKSNNTNNSQHGVKQESEGAAGFGNPLKRSRDGSDGNGWADKSKASENETALVTQKMFEDWRNLNTQDLVTGTGLLVCRVCIVCVLCVCVCVCVV